MSGEYAHVWAAALVERATPDERERETLETWRLAALSKDRTRRAIRSRVRAGENQMEVADDFGVPLAFVTHLAQWQLFSDPDDPPAVAAQVKAPASAVVERSKEQAPPQAAVDRAPLFLLIETWRASASTSSMQCADELEALLRAVPSERENGTS